VGDARIGYTNRANGFRSIEPPTGDVETATDVYVHITSNNTIVGSQWKTFPDFKAPLVADMSSDILSRAVDVTRFQMIYAGAQKNLGVAGVTLVIARRDWLEASDPVDHLPKYLHYATHLKANSLYNTPPVFAIAATRRVLEWVEREGGVPELERRNRHKASLVYAAIEESGGFYEGIVAPSVRSDMNATFRLQSTELEQAFLEEAAAAGFRGLAGHRSVGGCRASLYNAVPVAAVERLTTFMHEFRRRRQG